MKTRPQRKRNARQSCNGATARRIELGKYIVVDPLVGYNLTHLFAFISKRGSVPLGTGWTGTRNANAS